MDDSLVCTFQKISIFRVLNQCEFMEGVEIASYLYSRALYTFNLLGYDVLMHKLLKSYWPCSEICDFALNYSELGLGPDFLKIFLKIYLRCSLYRF